MENGLQKISKIKSKEVNAADLALALLCDLGARCSSMNTNQDGDKDLGRGWEWFDPSQVTNPENLPEPWKTLLFAMNNQCWVLGYKFIHSPEPIRVFYPDIPVKGIFVVTRATATPDDVDALDLIHAGGQFVEYDVDNKGIVYNYIDE